MWISLFIPLDLLEDDTITSVDIFKSEFMLKNPLYFNVAILQMDTEKTDVLGAEAANNKYFTPVVSNLWVRTLQKVTRST